MNIFQNIAIKYISIIQRIFLISLKSEIWWNKKQKFEIRIYIYIYS